jgi:hypothetical protein
VPQGTEPVTSHERALESSRVSRLQAHPLHRKALALLRDRSTRTTAWQGSGIATSHVALDLPPGAGLWSHHVPCCPRPPGRARAFPRRLTLGSSWPHQARGAGGALNAYVTGHTQRMSGIKCIQDIDTAEQWQYITCLLVTHNGQATVRGD